MRIWKPARKDGGGAAGAINRWLWPRLAPELCDRHGATLLLGSGAGLSAAEPALEHYGRVIAFGAGAAGPADLPDMTGADWDLRFVRGPETAALLGRRTRWICDPAALAADALPARRPRRARARSRRAAFMPGRAMSPRGALRLAAAAGLPLIETHGRLESWLHQLLDCDALLCAEPSAAAAADALGIPWRPLQIGGDPADDGTGPDFEWRDVMGGIRAFAVALVLRPPADGGTGDGRTGEPISRLLDGIALRRAAAELRGAARGTLFTLSDRADSRRLRQELRAALEDLRAEAAPAFARPRLRAVPRAAAC